MKKLGGWWRIWITISAIWSIAILGFVIFQPKFIGTPPMTSRGENYFFWSLRIPNTYQQQAWDMAAKEKGVKPWSKVQSLATFQHLTPKEKEDARKQYWKDVVFPEFLHPNVLVIIAFVVMPIILLLITGWTVRWIIDGFRRA